jgi:uncharacterized coiled-coil DUF342 family protein
MTPREAYLRDMEAARNQLAVECKSELLGHQKQIDRAHKRIDELVAMIEDRDRMIGQLQERMDKMSEWAKTKGK